MTCPKILAASPLLIYISVKNIAGTELPTSPPPLHRILLLLRCLLPPSLLPLGLGSFSTTTSLFLLGLLPASFARCRSCHMCGCFTFASATRWNWNALHFRVDVMRRPLSKLRPGIVGVVSLGVTTHFSEMEEYFAF